MNVNTDRHGRGRDGSRPLESETIPGGEDAAPGIVRMASVDLVPVSMNDSRPELPFTD